MNNATVTMRCKSEFSNSPTRRHLRPSFASGAASCQPADGNRSRIGCCNTASRCRLRARTTSAQIGPREQDRTSASLATSSTHVALRSPEHKCGRQALVHPPGLLIPYSSTPTTPSWTVVQSQNLAPISPNAASVLYGVSCSGTNFCMAVGFSCTGSGDCLYSTDGSQYQTLAEDWNGSTWSLTPSPDVTG